MPSPVKPICKGLSFMVILRALALLPALAAILFSGAASGDTGRKVVVINSRHVQPYLHFEEMVLQGLSAPGRPVLRTEVFYADRDGTDRIGQAALEADLVILIGSRACEIFETLKGRIPVLVTFAVEKTLRHLREKGLKFWAISMEIPLERRLQVASRLFPGGRAVVFEDQLPVPGRAGAMEVIRIVPDGRPLMELLKQALVKGADLLVITPDTRVFRSPELVKYAILWGIRNRMAVMGLSAGYVSNGALLAVEPDYRALGRQTARTAILIMKKGGVGSEALIIYPEEEKISLNLRTARRIGLSIPDELLEEASLVIE